METSMVHTEYGLIKVIEDHESLRIKMCPRRERERGDFSEPEYDEVDEALETQLDWRECNILIRHIQRHRDRVFGTPA